MAERKSEQDKEARKKRKEERRKKRDSYQTRLASVPADSTDQRNPIIIEIVREHLHKDIDVFQARWQTGAPLSNAVFVNTPLFWYKKHKWSHKDVKEFFKIAGVYKDNLDSELSIIWGIDEKAKKRKKEKRKKMKEKHLRKESFASLLTLRHSSLRLMQERSMTFVQKNDPKADRASVNIWNYLVKGMENEKKERVNHAQFNICLNDNNISIGVDMSVDLFHELIRTWEIIEKHREDKRNNPELYKQTKKDKYKQSRSGIVGLKAIGGNSAFGVMQQMAENEKMAKEEREMQKKVSASKTEEEDLPQKDKIKYIKKKYVDRQYIKRMLRHINKNIKREHTIANPKKLKKSKLLLVVFGKVFDAIQNQTAFDVQNDYISQALTQEQLNNPTALLEILETRDAEWKQRVQCLEYIEANISINENLGAMLEEETFLLLIVGWCTQLYDERSRITQTAAELFPSLLTQCLGAMDTPAIVFEEENGCLTCIFEGLFTLLKNKRAKTLADIAHDVLIETINIFSTVAQDLDETAYMKIINFLYDHTVFEKEKHEKVRAGSIAYALFVIYGTESQELQNSNTLTVLEAPQLSKSISVDSVPSDGENEAKEEKKDEEKQGKDPRNVKIAKKPQRAFLFSDDAFMQIFAKLIGNGIEDRSKETREKAMKVLKKIEHSHREIIEKYIDPLHFKKYQKWLKYSAPKKKGKGKKGSKKKRERISPIKRAKTQAPKKFNLSKGGAGAKSVGAVNANADEDNNGNEQNGGSALNIPNGTQ